MIKPIEKNVDGKLYNKGNLTELVVVQKDNYLVYLVYVDKVSVDIEIEAIDDFPLDSILVGKVSEVREDINSAFVMLPFKKKAYLRLNDDYKLKPEQNIPVRIVKSSSKGKLMSVKIEDYDISHLTDLSVISVGESSLDKLCKLYSFDNYLVESESIKEKLVSESKIDGISDRIHVYSDNMVSLSVLYSVSKTVKETSEKCVWLKSGANILIETTSALTVIDVNSAKIDKNKEDSFLKVNLEAADEIFRQMTLRNISGMIIVDFINMKSKEDNNILMDKLKESAEKQKIKTKILDMTKLGLVEITRQKTGATIYDLKY